MGYGVEAAYVKSEADFIAPPSWGLWFRNIEKGAGNFVIFKDLPQLKAAVTREWHRHKNSDVLIYEHKGGEWVLAHEINWGQDHKQHHLWRSASRRGASQVPPTQSSVDEAMESILTSIQKSSHD